MSQGVKISSDKSQLHMIYARIGPLGVGRSLPRTGVNGVNGTQVYKNHLIRLQKTLKASPSKSLFLTTFVKLGHRGAALGPKSMNPNNTRHLQVYGNLLPLWIIRLRWSRADSLHTSSIIQKHHNPKSVQSLSLVSIPPGLAALVSIHNLPNRNSFIPAFLSKVVNPP